MQQPKKSPLPPRFLLLGTVPGPDLPGTTSVTKEMETPTEKGLSDWGRRHPENSWGHSALHETTVPAPTPASTQQALEDVFGKTNTKQCLYPLEPEKH